MNALPLTIVQISDLHLTAMAADGYRDRDVWRQLEAVLVAIGDKFPRLDRLLVTGDNVHEGGREAYQELARRLDRWGFCWDWIPGNHDDAVVMNAIRANPGWPAGAAWQCLLLDSTGEPDGFGAGSLTADSLAALAHGADDSRPALVVLHHNPMAVDSVWQDRIGLQNTDRFWSLVNALNPKSLVLCGHLHQVWDRNDLPLRVLSCPSTAVQFRPRCGQLELETVGECALPGYRWLKLGVDGCVETGIERVRLA